MEFLHQADQKALEWVQTLWGHSRLDHIMIDLSALGGRPVLTLVVLCSVGLLLCVRRYRTAGFVLAAALGGALLAFGCKELIARDRPPLHHPEAVLFDVSPSFPSGHSMLSAVIYLTLALIATAVIRRWRVRVYVVGIALMLAGLIGASRVYLAFHYLTDVIGGWAGGLAWALLCRWLEYHWVARAEKRAAAVAPDSL